MQNRLWSRCASSSRRLVQLGRVAPMRSVPPSIPVPPQPRSESDYNYCYNRPYVLSESEIARLRSACAATREVLDFAGECVVAGVTTEEIDRKIHEKIVSLHGYPACLNYHGFPKSCAISPNEVVCHGIPDSRELEEGDIINIDLVVYRDGFHGDSSRMYEVGCVSPSAHRLVEATRIIMTDTIGKCIPGTPYNALGKFIDAESRRQGYSSVESYCSHGVGRFMHMYPFILHVPNPNEATIRENTAFTIEPMINEGAPDVYTATNEWTVITKDHFPSAQFEHTLLITRNGPEILT